MSQAVWLLLGFYVFYKSFERHFNPFFRHFIRTSLKILTAQNLQLYTYKKSLYVYNFFYSYKKFSTLTFLSLYETENKRLNTYLAQSNYYLSITICYQNY